MIPCLLRKSVLGRLREVVSIIVLRHLSRCTWTFEPQTPLQRGTITSYTKISNSHCFRRRSLRLAKLLACWPSDDFPFYE
jgi:hypothetical protein